MSVHIAKALDPVEAMRKAHADALIDVATFKDEVTLIIKPETLVTVARYLRDTPGLIYNFLSDISAVDYFNPQGGYDGRPERFAVSYHLYSMLYNRRIRVKTFVAEEEPHVPTLTVVWPAANWLEREIIDMMGITFDGHPDPRRLLMPKDWDGHPHRRDYPLGYEQVMFSFNVEDIIKHKPNAKDGQEENTRQ
ncbi:MAG: NADH-quinone oxidoreductase subunit C [Chloroflexota bacterium]|nr:NADH-quinone oxidoreductase subunit C [Chloroflexota bacterium]